MDEEDVDGRRGGGRGGEVDEGKMSRTHYFFLISAIYTMVHSLSIIQVAAQTSTNNNQVYVINPRYHTHDCYVYYYDVYYYNVYARN